MLRKPAMALFSVAFAALSACSQSYSQDLRAGVSAAPDTGVDLILTNGRIYTVDSNRPWVEAVAIHNGNIVGLGDAAVSEFRGPGTTVIDLAGKMAMPGIVDGHVHPTRGALMRLYRCNFPFDAAPEEVSETVRACGKDNPEAG